MFMAQNSVGLATVLRGGLCMSLKGFFHVLGLLSEVKVNHAMGGIGSCQVLLSLLYSNNVPL